MIDFYRTFAYKEILVGGRGEHGIKKNQGFLCIVYVSIPHVEYIYYVSQSYTNKNFKINASRKYEKRDPSLLT